MENKFGMVGMGRIENGVMKFMDASGKGFVKPVLRREPAVINEVSMIEEEVIVKNEGVEVIDVPDFIKEAIKKRKQEERKVIYVQFNKQEEPKEEEEKEHPVVEALYKGLGVARKKMVNNPVFKYFFDDHEQVKKGDK